MVPVPGLAQKLVLVFQCSGTAKQERTFYGQLNISNSQLYEHQKLFI